MDSDLYFKYRRCFLKTARKFNTCSYVISLVYANNKPGFLNTFRIAHQKYYQSRKVEVDTKHADSILTTFNLKVTGVRPYETIIGYRPVTQGTMINIYGKSLGPDKDSLDILRSSPSHWEQFLTRLDSIEFFRGMTREEKCIYMDEEQLVTDTDLAEAETELEVVQLGTGNFSELEPGNIEQLLTKRLPALEVRNMFPFKIGSRARRNSLALIRSFWKVYTAQEVDNSFTGIVIKVDDGDIYVFDQIPKKYTSRGGKHVPIEFTKIGIQISSSIKFNDESLTQLSLQFHSSNVDLKTLDIELSFLTLGGFKSLIQKLVRFRPINVTFRNNIVYSSRDVLVRSLTKMLLHPGSFVPDIQRYVGGIESCLKRLAVSIVEDSYVNDYGNIVKLLAGALVAQRSKVWKPTSSYLKLVYETALEALVSDNYYEWKNDEYPPAVIQKSIDDFTLASCLIDEIRSLKTDYLLFRSLFRNKGKNKKTYVSRPDKMPVWHCIDQHWVPDFVYLLPSETVTSLAVPGLEPYKKLLRDVFHKVTGFNTRKSDYTSSGFVKSDSFIQVVKKAQLLAYQIKTTSYRPRNALTTYVTGEYALDRSWIAGMVGVIESNQRPPVLITLKPQDPEQFVVVRRPSRDMKEHTITAEREEAAIEEAKRVLKRGVKLDKIASSIPTLKNATLIRSEDDEEVFIFQVDGKNKTWDEVSQIIFKVPQLTPSKSIFEWSNGIEIDANEKLSLDDGNTIRRALTYLTGFKPVIELPKISRDGGGTKGAVSVDDVAVYHFLLELSTLYPAALRRREGSIQIFDVVNGPILWSLVDWLRSKMQVSFDSNWPLIKKPDRKPWSHQEESLREMIEVNKNGRKGHFLWIPVGLGKTFIVLSYVRYLDMKKKLPPYIIYTLPASAIASIINEIKVFGLDFEIMIPTKSISKDHPFRDKINNSCTPARHKITLIEHDHLRRCEEQLTTHITESLFIIDEVHKALNETKRTALALQLSHLSVDFIALTGTPIIDTNIYKLIWWLEQIVPFEVNELNFWVAANSMVAKKVTTGVIVNTLQYEAQMTKDEVIAYKRLVGPVLGGTNQNPRIEDINRALDICYTTSTRTLVQLTLDKLRQKEGVMLVAKNVSHQEQLAKQLVEGGVNSRDIFLITKDKTIYFTDEAVESGKVHDYKVVIVPIQKSEGYTLTRLKTMITGVYPSNNATREQIEGRINRISQKSKTVDFITVHTGILTYIMNKHVDARNISKVLQNIAQNIEL